MRLGAWLEGQIDPVTERMRPTIFSVQRYPRDFTNNSIIASMNETQLNALQYKLNMTAARWLNKNGTTPAPFLFFIAKSPTCNVTVYKVSVKITDTVIRRHPRQLPVQGAWIDSIILLEELNDRAEETKRIAPLLSSG